ncbi:hypothetical protein GYMLUDRAFT_736808 [Collybiopsis luxurians FD-317 M1]|uniref:Uncharacterized protein n=1 Tax=Collybiopsis luxurians FD-317 M1 TaxID=944289 RepID=A0A0D0B3P1_9AGAR|nr:hypothetical protein GYMLUDRAFT_736808 [Collybiopsis luxurians FD-317 M1]
MAIRRTCRTFEHGYHSQISSYDSIGLSAQDYLNIYNSVGISSRKIRAMGQCRIDFRSFRHSPACFSVAPFALNPFTVLYLYINTRRYPSIMMSTASASQISFLQSYS